MEEGGLNNWRGISLLDVIREVSYRLQVVAEMIHSVGFERVGDVWIWFLLLDNWLKRLGNMTDSLFIDLRKAYDLDGALRSFVVCATNI